MLFLSRSVCSSSTTWMSTCIRPLHAPYLNHSHHSHWGQWLWWQAQEPYLCIRMYVHRYTASWVRSLLLLMRCTKVKNWTSIDVNTGRLMCTKTNGHMFILTYFNNLSSGRFAVPYSHGLTREKPAPVMWEVLLNMWRCINLTETLLYFSTCLKCIDA